MVNDAAAGTENAKVLHQYFRHQRDWRPNTLRLRRIQLAHLAEYLQPGALTAATEDDLLGWRDEMPRTWSTETVIGYISAARGLYRWMSARSRPRIRIDDPSVALDYPRKPERRPRPMLAKHFDLALSCALRDPEMFAWLGLAGCSGLRCCEIAWLRGTDVEELDDGCGLLHLEGKGGKWRTTPVGSDLMLVLDQFVRRAGRGPVFTRPSDGQAHTPQGVSYRINRFLTGVGITETAHQMRHLFATDYHLLDPDIFRQAEVMGHSSVEETRKYTLTSPAEAARFVEKLTRARLRNRPARGGRARVA
ncbi:tyrosine-type recombinase/integrase [Pseudonocardia sp. NPDC049635]|uniref:tyrosine-type recombinase/integrase n=1 Tax=Pseudonocardia sp. NPDC049635 TaxID=3155506 RepID=UPI0033FAC680